MWPKDLSIQVKQTIVRLQKQNKSIREIAKTLGVAKSSVSYILRIKKERTAEFSNIKRPGGPQRTTVADDRRIFSIVKKKPFTTSSQDKNTLQEVSVSLSKSTIKRRLQQSKCRGYITRCKQGQIRRLNLRSTCTRLTCKNKVWRRLGTAHDPKHTTSSVKHGGVVWWQEYALLPVAGPGILFIGDVTEDRSSEFPWN